MEADRMTANGRRVLISGASVAGPVLAYWLNRFGYQPTVVERTAELRFGRGGHAVDLFGPALQIIEWMGALAQVRDARTRTETIEFLREGHRPVDVPAEMMSEGVSGRHIEIMRGDLAKIIYDVGRNDIEYLFGNSIMTLQETEQAIEVSFQHGAPQTFDLVIGADGLHSITRRLGFGDEQQFLHFLGGYLAVFTVPNYLDLRQRMIGFADVGRTAAIYPVHGTGQARVLLLWRARTPHDYGLAAYEQALRPAVQHSQTIGPAVLRTLIPRSHLQVWATAQAIRLLPRLPALARRRLTSFGGGPAAMLNVVKLRDPSTL